MRAMAIHAFGGIEQLQAMDLPVPEAGDGEVLIRIQAAGVNPVDCKIREGLLRDRLPYAFPLIPGWDAAGVVEAVGAGVPGFHEGDEVYAYCRKPVIQGGTYAEYVAVPHENAARKPATMTFEEAATVPLAALTAYQCLFEAAKLAGGETVLVHAAAGGVGGFAVQLAHDIGAKVVGTARADSHSYLRSLGCDEPIDYATGDFRAGVRRVLPAGVDVVLDCVGGEVMANSVDVLRPGGRIVSILNPAAVDELKARGIAAHYVFVRPHHGHLAELTRLIERGRLRTQIASRFRLEDAAQAQAMIEQRHTRGKIVLTV